MLSWPVTWPEISFLVSGPVNKIVPVAESYVISPSPAPDESFLADKTPRISEVLTPWKLNVPPIESNASDAKSPVLLTETFCPIA